MDGMKRLFLISLVALLGFSFVIPISSSLSAGTLKVTSPNGGQKWTTGKKHVIKWAKGNGGTHVKIQLFKSNKHYKWISKKTKNDGKHPWKVPASVATGSAYKIRSPLLPLRQSRILRTITSPLPRAVQSQADRPSWGHRSPTTPETNISPDSAISMLPI